MTLVINKVLKEVCFSACLLKRQPPSPAERPLIFEASESGFVSNAMLEVEGEPVRFEIILEGRIELEAPGPDDVVCGVRCLTLVDTAAEKLLANSDRWADASTHSRDLIDLAMMPGDGRIPAAAMAKALQAYSSIEADLKKAQAHVSRDGRLSACMEAMQMTQPPALVMDRILKLRAPPTRAKPQRP